MTQLQKITLALLVIAVSRAPASAQQPPAPAATTPATTPVVETNPAVRAALEIPRETPADYFQAVTWLIDLERPELAKPIMDELAKLQLTNDERIALVAEFGSHSMLQVSGAKELAPTGAAFADDCMAAAAAAETDPGRIAALIAQLNDPSAEIRTAARNDLAATGQVGVTATLEAVAREPNPQRRAALLTAAAQMDPLIVEPLLAILDTKDPALRADVAALLKHLRVHQAAPLLAQDTNSAEDALVAEIENSRRGTPPFEPDESNRITLWHWDDAAKKLSPTAFSAHDARILWMSRLARRLAELRPRNRAYQRQAMLLELEAKVVPPAQVAPALGDLAKADTRLVNDLLADALEANYARAAVAAAETLGRRRDSTVVDTSDGQPSPLADALIHPSRRVRFAAMRAILDIDPASPYPGSSRLPEAATWFANGSGKRRALVAMPTLAASSDIAGMLAAYDLDAHPTNRGRNAVDLAVDMADLEMIFVDMGLLLPEIRQVLYELRISPTTGQIPIAILAADGRLQAAERIAAEHDRVIAVPRPHTADILARVVQQLTELAGTDTDSPEIRAQQAQIAQTWLATLSTGYRPFYTIRQTPPPDAIAFPPGAPPLAPLPPQ